MLDESVMTDVSLKKAWHQTVPTPRGLRLERFLTGHAIIQVADDGENAIVLFGGANRDWSSADIDRLLSSAASGDVLLLQNEINMMSELMTAAADAGMRLAMNPAPMGPEVKGYPLNRLTWLVVNEIEGRELAGIDLENTGGDEADDAVVVELRRLYPEAIIVMTLGKKRCNQG
jgi:ribokinase